MDKKLFHICNVVVDEKFIDGAIETMDLFSDKWNADWIIYENDEIKFIKRNLDRIEIIKKDCFFNYLNEHDFDALVLHSFIALPPALVAQIPSKIKVFWFGWGGDIYNYPNEFPFVRWNLYKPLTYDYLNTPLRKVKKSIKSIVNLLFGVKCFYRKLYINALKRIDFFSGVLDFEYYFLRANPNFKAKKVAFNYTSLTGLNSYDNYKLYNGKNILVGNSAAVTNNHLDLLKYLQKLNISDRKIILPLSYAGFPKYVKKVKDLYKRIFAEKVIALTDFIPYAEYQNYILSCDTAVFFTERQQAMGNINSALIAGCKVFMSNRNPVYAFYREKGVVVFSVEDHLSGNNINLRLTNAEIENNRRILKDMFGYEAFIRKLSSIYQALNE